MAEKTLVAKRLKRIKGIKKIVLAVRKPEEKEEIKKSIAMIEKPRRTEKIIKPALAVKDFGKIGKSEKQVLKIVVLLF